MMTGCNNIKKLHAAIKRNFRYKAASFTDKILHCIIMLGFLIKIVAS